MIKLDLPTKKEFLDMIENGTIQSIRNSDYSFIHMDFYSEFYYQRHKDVWLKNNEVIAHNGIRFEFPKKQGISVNKASIMPVIRDKDIVNMAISQIDPENYIPANNIVYLKNIYYPLFAPNRGLQRELEDNYKILRKTEIDINDKHVYFYKGNFYVRTTPLYEHAFEIVRLNYGDTFNLNRPIWVEVECVPWVVDVKMKLLISKCTLMSGIPYYTDRKNNLASVHEMLKRISITMEKCRSDKAVNERTDFINKYKKAKVLEIVEEDVFLQMLMSKENIGVEDLEINNEDSLVLRR